MAFDAGIQIEINSAGSDTANGGGFSPLCTGFATDLAATSANTASPAVTSASYNFVSADEGHFLFIQTGTNARPGFWKIVTTSANAATLDAAVGSGVLWWGGTTGTTSATNPTPTNLTAGISNPAVSLTGVTWGIDYSRKTSARTTFTDMVIDGTTNTKFTSSLNPVGVNMIGNTIRVTSGTGFTVQTVQIVSTATTTATVDKSLGTLSSTGGNGGLGGSVASPAFAAGVFNLNHGNFFLWGGAAPNTYNMVNSANTAGGFMNFSGGNQFMIGYDDYTNRYSFNSPTNRPIVQSNANSITLMADNGGQGCGFHSIIFNNGNANTTITAINLANGAVDSIWNCKFNAVSIAINNFQNNTTIEKCWFNACTNGTTCVAGVTGHTLLLDCIFTANTQVSIAVETVDGCVFYNNGSSSAGIITGARNCNRTLFHTVTGTGSQALKNTQSTRNCIFVSVNNATGHAIDCAIDQTTQIFNCAFYNNTVDSVLSSTTSSLTGSRMQGKIVLTGDPITNVAAGDFSLNNTAGAGALLRGLAFPTTFANGLTTSAMDVGPAQSVASAGGATAYAF